MNQQGNAGLVRWLREKIDESGRQAISFRDYMAYCLYHPTWGYYTAERPKLGKEGDFYTSAALGSLMGEMIAAWIVGTVADAPEGGPLTLIEWGGGGGKLAADVLDALQAKEPALYARLRFIAVELSPYHRRLQQERLAAHAALAEWLTEEEWRSRGPWRRAVVWSNELLDAFPVQRLVYDEAAGWQEVYVGWDEAAARFAERLLPLSDAQTLAYIASEGLPTRGGQRFEVNLAAPRWMKEVAARLQSGWLLTIDYGDVGRELYASHRMAGTLLCYRGHRAADRPLDFPGEQDMTAHVNFSALMRAGDEAGLTLVQWTTQKQFLLEQGLLGQLQNHSGADPFSAAARRNRAIRQLLLSDGMSELFKVLIHKKDDPRE